MMRKMTFLRRLKRDRNRENDTGAQIIEFIIVLPLILALCSVICDIGLYESKRLLLEGQTTDTIRYIQLLTQPNPEEGTDTDFDDYFNSNGSPTPKLMSKVKEHINANYASRMDVSDISKWSIDIKKTKSTTSSSVLDTSDETFGYHMYIGDHDSGGSATNPSPEDYETRESNFKSCNITVSITYKDDYIFPIPFFTKMAAGETPGAKTSEHDYEILVSKTGSFYIGGINW